MAFQIAYQTVFELSVWHHHFLDPLTGPAFTPPPTVGISAEQTRLLLRYDVRRFLDVQPTPESLEVIRQRGLIYKNTGRGCVLVAKDTYSETDPEVKVSVVLRVKDPAFFTYTNFDFTTIGDRIFYLTNFGLPHPAPRITLSEAGGNPFLRDIHRSPRKGRIVRIDQTIPGANTTVEVFDVNTSPEEQVLTFDLFSVPDQPAYEMDCRSLREGPYRFEAPNIATSEYYLGLESQGVILGVVEFFLAGLNDAQYDIRLASN